MNIQHLSIVVPNKECVNKCPFCVSRMLNHQFENKMDINHPHYDINVKEYMKRLEYVSNNGCDTIMFTGTTEPQQNKQFLATFALLNKMLRKPFTNIEMQTTGMFLTGNADYIRFLRNFVGVNTIALSINATDDEKNNDILGHSSKLQGVNLGKLSHMLHDYDFNIRLCFNLTDAFECLALSDLINWSKANFASQITFRVMYSSQVDTPQGKWISEHAISTDWLECLDEDLSKYPSVGTNVYGTELKDIDGMSVFFDKNCIGKHHTKEASDAKHFILAPNCKLYSSWDSKAGLVF